MFKNIRRYYWLVQEFFKRHFGVIGKTIGIVIIVSVILTLSLRYLPSPRNLSRIGIIGKYTSETLPLSIQSQISEGLVHMNDQGDPTAGLATSWEIGDDGKTYTFHLDNSLTWHDGTKLQADDISYNFKDVDINKDGNTVTFKLKEPFTPFFYAVEKPLLKAGKYGVGQYRLGKCVIYTSILQSCSLIGDTTKLTYKFYPTENAAITAYKLGEIDKIENISYVPKDVLEEPQSQIENNHNFPRIAVLFLNNNDTILGSKSARQGLAYAIHDKSFGHDRALSPIGNDSWAFNPLVKSYDFDPERAKSLFSQDIDKPENVTIDLKTTLQYLDVAESIAQDWRDNLGIKVDVKVVTAVTSDYQVLLIDYASPADPDQYTTWHSTQPGNYTHYTNLKVDKLLEDGRRTTDRKLRKDIYQDFQRFLLEDSPAIFLFNTTSYNLSRKSLF